MASQSSATGAKKSSNNMSPSKSTGNQHSKRKKEIENSKDGGGVHLGRIKYEWTQSDETLQITLSVDKLNPEELKEADVEVTDSNIKATFKDGRQWTCRFTEQVEGKQSRVIVQGKQLCIWLIKKKAKNWSKHHVVDTTPKMKKKTPTEVKVAPVLVKKVDISGDVKDREENVPATVPEHSPVLETKFKEEEPVYQLQHVKNDWIENSKNEIFTVHVYVRQTPKDSVQVFYEEDSVTVKFQTKESKFLSLHANTTEDTVFCWSIKLKHDIIPEQSRHNVTSSFIELALRKKKAFRWGALEAPVNQPNTPLMVAKSDNLQSTSDTTNQDPVTSKSSQSSVAFDELSDVKVCDDDDDIELLEETSTKTSTPSSSSSILDKENIPQKPMCKVSPLNKPSPVDESLVIPGKTGLENLGNTCFMNSVLQALANTREFRDYFLDARFQREINTDNVLGSGGKLAVAFAVLMKVLWAGTHYSYPPSKLKNLVALKASQFTGYAQHDAQEFMAFLLDGLHEDLNRIKKKPYIESKDSGDRPDEVVADEAWSAYKKRNDSFVVDLFQGQYKSKLVCPQCGKVSITFDPFLYLSVPLPKKKRLLPITFISKEPHNKPLKMMLSLSKDASVDKIKEQVSRKTGVKPCDLRIFEAYKGRIHKFFTRSSDLSNVQTTDNIIVNEVLSEDVAGENVFEINVIQRTVMPNEMPVKCAECKKPCVEGGKLKRCTKCYKVGYCDQVCQKHHWQYHRPHCKNTLESVGCPFIVSIPESRATFKRLCKLMEAFARYSVDVFQPPVKADSPTKLTSQLSNSDLSSSSQSSGSLSSLDSQSSLSSTCTLTADGEMRLSSDNDDCERAESCGDDGTSDSLSLPQAPPSSGYSSMVSAGGDSSDGDNCPTNANPTSGTFSTNDNRGEDLTEMPPPSSIPRSAAPPTTHVCETSPGYGGLPTNMVLGVQVDDEEKFTPSFYIKPVNQYGEGLTGQDSERLEDKGDVALDLSQKKFLSMDWKNNDRINSYVLVQTKILECDEDSSVQNTSFDENGNITLDHCLQLFTEPEVLAPDEAWFCPQCKAHREATKQMSIWRLPHTLIIQLKRFSFRNFIWRDKIDKMVEFPTRGLDLSDYFIGTRPTSEPRALYDLYAVVNHHGGILGGHYTAYVRCADLLDPNKSEVDWRLCDDSRVHSCSEKNVVTRAAYVLFYRRRNMFVPLPPAVFSNEEEVVESSLTKGDNSLLGLDKEDELPELMSDKEPVVKFDLQQQHGLDNRVTESLEFTDMDSVD